MHIFIYILVALISKTIIANNHVDDKCEKVLAAFADTNDDAITQLYAFKRHNKGQWIETGKLGKMAYTLEPKELTTYTFSWTVKNRSSHTKSLVDGDLTCEVPKSWLLMLSPPVNITYPKVVHKQKQVLSLHSLETVAGICLGEGKFSTMADFVSVMWHLSQDEVSEDNASAIIAQHEFIKDNVAVVTNSLDKMNNVQLVALHVSDREEITDTNPQWLVATSEDHRAIAEGNFKTSESRYDAFLPWLDPTRPEFLSTTPKKAFDTTIVAPLEPLSVFDRKSSRFLPEPIALQGKTQMVHDAIAPAALNFLKGTERLFTHLVLKQPRNYQFLTFEILPDGTFEQRSTQTIDDPGEIGLPSARELGFTLHNTESRE